MDTQARTMKCEDADRILDGLFGRPAETLPEKVREHLASCPRCARLYRWAVSDAGPWAVSEDFTARLQSLLAEDLRPVKPAPSGPVLALRFAGVFGLLLVVWMLISGLAGAHAMTTAQMVSVSAVLAAGAIFLSVSLSWQIVPGKARWLSPPLLIGVFLAGFLTVVGVMLPWESSGEIFAAGWLCTYHGLIAAIPAAAILTLLALRGAPLSFRALGTSIGAASGLLALTVLQFGCKNQHAGHVLVWHGAAMLGCLGAGYALGAGADRLRARRIHMNSGRNLDL